MCLGQWTYLLDSATAEFNPLFRSEACYKEVEALASKGSVKTILPSSFLTYYLDSYYKVYTHGLTTNYGIMICRRKPIS